MEIAKYVYVEESFEKRLQVKLFHFPLHYNRNTNLMKYWRFHSKHIVLVEFQVFWENNELRLSVAIYDLGTLIFVYSYIFSMN